MGKNFKDEKSFVDFVFLIYWFFIIGIVGKVLFFVCVGLVVEIYLDVRIYFEYKFIVVDIEGGYFIFKW